METSMIEKLDKSRYQLVLWLTVGWAIYFGGFILKDLVSDKALTVVIILAGLIGWILFLINLIRYIKFGRTVNSDNELGNALNDELHLFNRNRSTVVGFWAFLILLTLFFGLSIFTAIPALIVCELTLYFGIISALVSFLIFNRR